MRIRHAALVLALGSTALFAQAPAAGAGLADRHTYSSPLGFSFAIPADWEVVNVTEPVPEAKEKGTQNATSEEEKKGVACVKMGLTARRGDPFSVIVQVELPLDCFGQAFTERDLPDFATGASEGIKQNFDTGEPLEGSYMLGTHHAWVERVQGTPKGQPDRKYTLEIACALTNKAAVCWMTMAADDRSLAVFEHVAVTLDGEAAAALVPAIAFQAKPL